MTQHIIELSSRIKRGRTRDDQMRRLWSLAHVLEDEMKEAVRVLHGDHRIGGIYDDAERLASRMKRLTIEEIK